MLKGMDLDYLIHNMSMHYNNGTMQYISITAGFSERVKNKGIPIIVRIISSDRFHRRDIEKHIEEMKEQIFAEAMLL